MFASSQMDQEQRSRLITPPPRLQKTRTPPDERHKLSVPPPPAAPNPFYGSLVLYLQSVHSHVRPHTAPLVHDQADDAELHTTQPVRLETPSHKHKVAAAVCLCLRYTVQRYVFGGMIVGGMASHGLAWHGMAWHGMVWYGIS